ncbi:MAG: sigma-70 family RNA polymerase sigma factor [Ignavibacteria bacterium]|jgi:RNA polymerase sigma-70 factor (ECF subfamily)
MEQTTEVNKLINQLFRNKAGQLISTLTRIFGTENIDLAENVVQEAFLKACQKWPYNGIPDNPSAWLTTVAKNNALNMIKREKAFNQKEADIVTWYKSVVNDSVQPEIDDAISIDDQLKMIFICCNPILSKKAQVCLTLKTVGGFSVGEIARAFLSNVTAVQKLLTRAKQKIRDEKIPFGLPSPFILSKRVDSVIDILYAIFNEGYSAYSGEELIRKELCDEAIRLTSLFLHETFAHFPKIPTIKALLALMLLHSSRIPARLDESSNMILLAEQNRVLWDKQLIAKGLKYLSESASGNELSTYHLEAHISACHAIAKTYEDSDWKQILQLYDDLMKLDPNPVIELNRIVALSMVKGPEDGLKELEKLSTNSKLKDYYLLPATFADFYYRLSNKEQAKYYYLKALNLTENQTEKRFIKKKMTEI